jgi:hypothetical protein
VPGEREHSAQRAARSAQRAAKQLHTGVHSVAFLVTTHNEHSRSQRPIDRASERARRAGGWAGGWAPHRRWLCGRGGG